MALKNPKTEGNQLSKEIAARERWRALYGAEQAQRGQLRFAGSGGRVSCPGARARRPQRLHAVCFRELPMMRLLARL